MHPQILREFDAICSTLSITGKVLEIGASSDHPLLLDLPALQSASKRVGVGLGPPFRNERFELLRRDANDLGCFDDDDFELVLCNATLEHDARFWLTVAEARRVTRPGGWIVFGAPSYGAMGSVPCRRIVDWLSKLPGVGRRWRDDCSALRASAPTLGLHYFPSDYDYYRFSQHAMEEVLLDGLESKDVGLLLVPPRVIGLGRKPGCAT